MKRSRLTAILLTLVMGLTITAGLTACGGSGGAEQAAVQDDGATASGAAVAAETDTSLTDIQSAGKFTIGCDDAFPPMGFDDNGEIKGFDIDLAKAVAEKIGVELVVKPIDWNAKELELTNGNIDAIWNGYTINADRNKQVEFSKPYLENTQRLVVKADSAVNSKADLAGKIVGTQVDSAAEEVIKADAGFLSSLKEELRIYNTYQEAMLDLKSGGRIDAVGGDQILIDYVMAQDPGTFRMLDDVLDSEYYGIGLRKGSVALREAIDKAIDELVADGTAAEISKKWFGADDRIVRDVAKLTDAELAS